MAPPSKKPQAPSLYLCDMTQQIMLDPVISKHGYTFERSFIMKWLAMGNKFCPLSGKDLSAKDLVAAKCLREEIHCWRADNGLPSDKNGPPSDKIVGMTLSVSARSSTTVYLEDDDDDFYSDAGEAETTDALASSNKPRITGPLRRLRNVFKVSRIAAS